MEFLSYLYIGIWISGSTVAASIAASEGERKLSFCGIIAFCLTPAWMSLFHWLGYI